MLLPWVLLFKYMIFFKRHTWHLRRGSPQYQGRVFRLSLEEPSYTATPIPQHCHRTTSYCLRFHWWTHFRLNSPGTSPHLFGRSANAQREGRFRENVGFTSQSLALQGLGSNRQTAGPHTLYGPFRAGTDSSPALPLTSCDPGEQHELWACFLSLDL